ncbi:hematopoietic death receptor isoform X1 [Mugil cephalus]|uniref:hematopoietic death receptor isoform X1 n=1 Tax=Mugil cephalus TaxID=48193 RepID=UPI001FB72A85|nr:hematopoietic death receptor isoform X1 [Mugil cephalus]
MNDAHIPVVVFALVWVLKPTGANLPSALDVGGSGAQRDVSCREDLEYLVGSICCLNCPAGKYVKSPCTQAGQKGECEECDYGTFTEHDNGLKQCFKCTPCHPDQEVVRQCTHTQDTECRCKSGTFCHPDHACEVCRKCSKCKTGEEIVRNCTSTTNTECKKIQPKSASATGVTAVIVACVVATLAIVGIAVCVCKKRIPQRDSGSDLPDRTKAGQYTAISLPGESGGGETGIANLMLPRQPVRAKSLAGVEDEYKMLCESLDSSASNSQSSLAGLPSSAYPATYPRASPVVPRQPNRREDEQLPKLVPMNGEESLKRCFGYFEELDVDQHKRFFRHLGISDNVIKSRENLLYEDRIHELLNIWVEKEGRDASLNDLLKALLELNQRRTAETVMENAMKDGHYYSS